MVIKTICLLAILMWAAYTDIKEYRIPNKIILWALACRGILLVLEFITKAFDWKVLLSEIFAALLVVIVTVMCRIIVKQGIGAGDFKLLFVMGLYLGIEDLWHTIVFSAAGALMGIIILLLLQKKKRNDTIPLAPFFAFGTLLSSLLFYMKVPLL